MKDLLLAIFKTGSSTFVKLLLSVLSMKVIAVLLGPAGVGMFSLLRQLMQTLSVIGLGGQTAIVQGLSGKEFKVRQQYMKTTFWVFSIGSAITVGLIFLFSAQLANFMFQDVNKNVINLVKWTSLPVVLLNFYFFLKSIINGFQEIGLLALVEISGPLALFLFIYPSCFLVKNGDYVWFIWLLSLMQLVMIGFSVKVVTTRAWLKNIKLFSGQLIDYDSWNHFKGVAVTIILTSFASVASLFIIKATITREMGIESTGIFDLSWSISGAYVMIMLAAFGTYYLPKLTEKGVTEEGKNLIGDILRLTIIFMVPLIIILIAVKPWLVKILYSEEFHDSLDLLRWMLIADYLKVTSWIFAIAVIARADMKTYFFTETIWYALFAVLSTVSVWFFKSLDGIAISFFILYILLLFIYQIYVVKYYNFKFEYKIVLPWLTGLLFVLISSYISWESNDVEWKLVLIAIVFLPVNIYWLMKPEERNHLVKYILSR